MVLIITASFLRLWDRELMPVFCWKKDRLLKLFYLQVFSYDSYVITKLFRKECLVTRVVCILITRVNILVTWVTKHSHDKILIKTLKNLFPS